MTKAEQRALEAYPYNRAYTSNDTEYDGNFCNRQPYIEGYEQAEQDLALNWKDIPKIIDLIEMVHDERGPVPILELRDFYEEVLRRFNESKQK